MDTKNNMVPFIPGNCEMQKAFLAEVKIQLKNDGRWLITADGREATARSGNVKFRADGCLDMETDHGDTPEDKMRYPTASETAAKSPPLNSADPGDNPTLANFIL